MRNITNAILSYNTREKRRRRRFRYPGCTRKGEGSNGKNNRRLSDAAHITSRCKTLPLAQFSELLHRVPKSEFVLFSCSRARGQSLRKKDFLFASKTNGDHCAPDTTDLLMCKLNNQAKKIRQHHTICSKWPQLNHSTAAKLILK